MPWPPRPRDQSSAEVCFALVAEPADRAGEAVAEGAADEEARERGGSILQLVLQRERHADLVLCRLEDHRLRPAQLLVLGVEREAAGRLAAGDPLLDEAAAARLRDPPHAAAGLGPVLADLPHVAEAVDPARPAGGVGP